jgi:uncharacterized surface protein with fasciclin (FAS1) repeats
LVALIVASSFAVAKMLDRWTIITCGSWRSREKAVKPCSQTLHAEITPRRPNFALLKSIQDRSHSMRSSLLFIISITLTGMLPTLTNAGGYVSDAAKEQNIIETAQDAGSFETLLAAIDAAGLTETLAEGGPFTVFAPTDAAFARIPQETLDALLKDKQALAKVLTYHVVAGEVRASEVVRLSSATTVEGSTLAIDTGSGVRIDDANVVATDITASNGVIHVIDKVLIP